MRKLAIAELAVFAATLLVSGNTSADEPPPVNLATVSVDGSYNTQANFGWYSGGFLNVGLPPTYLGNVSGYISAANLHALKCAKSYAATGPGANKGAKPGSTTYIIANHGWKNTTTLKYAETLSSTPPATGGPWTSISGVTYGTAQTMIFEPGNPTPSYLINTIAHEWAHQWGANEADAQAVGHAAELAYNRDHGDKCGGM